MPNQAGNNRNWLTMIDQLTNEANAMRQSWDDFWKGKILSQTSSYAQPAIRARSTAEAVAKASGYRGEIVLDKSLYAAGPDAYIGVMHDLSNEYIRALIIGHNPGLEELVEMLTGEIHLMPTCSLAHVKLRADKWSDIDNKIKGKVAEIWRPRDLT